MDYKPVYKIVKYDLKGATLYTKELLQGVKEIESNRNKMFVDNNGKEYLKSHLWELTTKPNEGAYSVNNKFLPYSANVIEDLPSSCKNMKPKVYNNCKLMTEKHGGYLQFYHELSKTILRIAFNSNYYEPITK